MGSSSLSQVIIQSYKQGKLIVQMKGRWKNCYPCMYGHIDAFFTLKRRVYIFCTHLHFESQLRLSPTQVFDIKWVKRNPQFDSPLTFLQVHTIAIKKSNIILEQFCFCWKMPYIWKWLEFEIFLKNLHKFRCIFSNAGLFSDVKKIRST